MPAKTQMFPDGCPTCLGVWEARKVDKKRMLKTIDLELTPEEINRYALLLKGLTDLTNARLLQQDKPLKKGVQQVHVQWNAAYVRILRELGPLYKKLLAAARES